MPSSFESFTTGDPVEASHVSEMHAPIQNLERGAAFYAGTTGGSSTAYSATLSPAPDNPYQAGMIVNFKIHADNTAGSPDVTLNLNGVSAKPVLKGGGNSLVAGDLKAGQMVSVIYDDASGGSFKLIGGSDVTINSPSSGQVVRHNGSNFVNANLVEGDLPSGIDASKIGGGAVTNTEFGYLDGVTSAIQTQINSHTHAASSINLGQVALAQGGTARDNSDTNVGMGTGVFTGGLSGGSANTAIGHGAAYSTTSANNNCFFGYHSGMSLTSGDNCSFYGSESGASCSTGANNAYFGLSAGYSATTANYCSAIGAFALYANTVNTNSAFGYAALYAATGGSNTACGFLAGYGITTAVDCCAFGESAMGSSAAKTGSYNHAFGYYAGYCLTSGDSNTLVGCQSGYYLTTGSGNSLFGVNAGVGLTTGSSNCIYGSYAGDAMTTASNAIVLGYNVDARSNTADNQINIGNCFERLPTTEATSVSATAKSYANSSTTDILTLANSRGRIEFFDSADGWAVVRFTNTTFSIEASSAGWVASGAPGASEIGLVAVSYTHLTLPTNREV